MQEADPKIEQNKLFPVVIRTSVNKCLLVRPTIY